MPGGPGVKGPPTVVTPVSGSGARLPINPCTGRCPVWSLCLGGPGLWRSTAEGMFAGVCGRQLPLSCLRTVRMLCPRIEALGHGSVIQAGRRPVSWTSTRFALPRGVEWISAHALWERVRRVAIGDLLFLC